MAMPDVNTVEPKETSRAVVVDDTVALVNSDLGSNEVHVYKSRWYILTVFSLLGILQGMVWNSFGPISASLLSVFCPTWTDFTLAMMGNWGNIMYIVPVVPIMWFFQTRGLRASMVLTASMMTLGTLLRCMPLTLSAFTLCCHVCAILNGMAGIVVFSAPSAVSSAWFPVHERTTATAVAIVFNNLGNALSFIAAPAIVPDPPDSNKTSSDVFASSNESECPVLEPEVKELIEFRIDCLMYFECALVSACFLAILVYFPSKPPRPPSTTSSMARMDFLAGIGHMLKKRDALLLTASFSLFNGLIASWYSVMNITFMPLPLGDPQNRDKIIGYIGLWSIVGNCVSTILVSRIVDSLRGHMKVTLSLIMVAAVVAWIWLGLLCLRLIPFSIVQLFVSTVLASSLTYSSGPIFFEMTVELVYPVSEGVVGGFLTCFYNGVGMIFLFLFDIPWIASNPHWIPYAFMSSVILSLPLMLVVQEQHNRSDIDRQTEDQRSPIQGD